VGLGRGFRNKKGCVYVRKSNKNFKILFELLDLIRLRESGNGYKRKIHVPIYIFNSPKDVIAGFLKGIFETDGFVDTDGRRIILFSKYKKFCKIYNYFY
jgi:intein/homing endonuclease